MPVNTLAGLPTGNSPYTVSVWIKTSSSNIGSRGIYSWGTYTGYSNNTLRLDSSNGSGFDHYWWNNDLIANGPMVANSGSSITVGTWMHVATRYDGATRAIYVNGVLVASDVPGVNGAANANFTVGTTNNNTYFNGYLDDLAIWNTALPETQIKALANNTITPLSGPKITAFASNKTTSGEGDTAQLSWTVNATNDTGALGVTITQGTTTVYTGSVASGTANVTLPSVNGTAQTVTYTLTATDAGSNATASTSLSINVTPDVPTATPQSGLVATAANALPITLAGTDPSNLPLTYAVVVPPAHGTLSSGTGAARTYTPASGYAGLDTFTFKVNNGKYDSPAALVSVADIASAAAPTAVALSNNVISTTLASGGYVGDFSSTDPNAEVPHTYALVSGTGSTDNATAHRTGVRGGQHGGDPRAVHERVGAVRGGHLHHDGCRARRRGGGDQRDPLQRADEHHPRRFRRVVQQHRGGSGPFWVVVDQRGFLHLPERYDTPGGRVPRGGRESGYHPEPVGRERAGAVQRQPEQRRRDADPAKRQRHQGVLG